MFDRRTVSYFEPQFNSTVVFDPGRFYDEEGGQQIVEITKDYNEIVFCVTELDLASKPRLKLLADLATTARDNGALVTADPWRVGGIFGGEGMSLYEQNGGIPCICEPKLVKIIDTWMKKVAAAGITRLFLDEPEIDCPIGDSDHTSFGLIKSLSEQARENDFTWVSSCIRSREKSIDMSDVVAALDTIDEIAVAPYPFHPQSTTTKPKLEIVSNLETWFNRIKSSADRHGKSSQAWMQGFNISQANEYMLDEYLTQIKKSGIGNIAVWGYNGCESVTVLNPKTALPGKQVYDAVTQLVMAA